MEKQGKRYAERVNRDREGRSFVEGSTPKGEVFSLGEVQITSMKLGPFLVLKKINDNAYVLDMPNEYGGSCTFNISNLSLFYASMDDLKLKTNSLQERE
ncbi:hypothetical protein CR513_15427, partial [Mucuna pruriens]